MKLTTCNEYFADWPIEEVFDYAADLGYEAVEIAPFTLADSVEDIPASRRAQIRAAAESAGVEIARPALALGQPRRAVYHPPRPSHLPAHLCVLQGASPILRRPRRPSDDHRLAHAAQRAGRDGITKSAGTACAGRLKAAWS